MEFCIIDSERVKHKMSFQDLADFLKVSRRTLQNWKNGISEIPLSKLIKMAELWNCSVDYLLGLTDERRPYGNVG